jgi:CheY-like chemotaxis protein
MRRLIFANVTSPTSAARSTPARSDAHPIHRRDDHRVRSGTGSDSHARPAPFGRRQSSREDPAPLQRTLTGLRVLVVDDDADVLELFAAVLTACGADVTTIDNARDAIALATRVRPHAIVSDIAMVGEDGYWLVRELKQLPATVLGDVPVIAATAYGREHPRTRVLAAGFTEHVQKPVDPEALCRLVARVAGV